MKPVYEIKFMSNEDFDNLPITETNGSDISDSLGFYNPFTNRVFIRHTAYPELNKYLLDHEFDHLVEESATDEDENGIRHKKGKKFFKEVFLPIFTGYNASKGSWSPLGISNTGGKPKEEMPTPTVSSPFGSSMGKDGGSITYATGQSPFSEQQSSQQGLNNGLNQQSLNPLEDPYKKYGVQAGRLYF